MKRFIVLALGLTVLCGCAEHSKYGNVSSEIEKILFYYEQDRSGENYGISAGKWDASEPVRVPDPALVDIDSTIHILTERQRQSSVENNLSSGFDDMTVRKKEMEELLVALDRVIVARKHALDCYLKSDDEQFIEAKHEFAQANISFLTILRKLYPDRSKEEYAILSRAAKDRTLSTLQNILQERVNEIVEKDISLNREAEKSQARLTLQAFLLSSGKEPVPLHLKGYDEIPQGQLKTHDRSGLNLSDADSQRLQDQIQHTALLAKTLNQVRDNEISLEDGLKETIFIISEDLFEYIEKFEILIPELEDKSRYIRIETEYVALMQKAVTNLSNPGSGMKEKIEALPGELIQELEEKSSAVVAAADLLEKLKQMKERFKGLQSAEDLVSLLSDTRLVTTNVTGLIEGNRWVKELTGDAETILQKQLDGFEEGATSELLNILNSDDGKTFMSETRSLYSDIQSGADIVCNVIGLLDFNSIDPVFAAPDMQEVFDVDMENLENTRLNLQRVPAMPGDEIRITAKLTEEGFEPKTSEASFKISQYGWYAGLSPSVVLARPAKYDGDNDGYQFAPVVSWNHHYQPRPDTQNWYSSLAGAFQPAAGLHAAFLSYNEDNDIEIGLGITVSFWNDRFQFGTGYNLMAENEDEGRFYFFVGSDLIGILQTIGIGK